LKYRPEIDGLRAIAVVPVILFHAGCPGFGGGYVGVDVFFVISGYLITGTIADEIRTGTFSLAGFYERRARRILPALILVCLCCIPFAWQWMTPDEYRDFSQSLGAVATFWSNILFLWQTDYFAPDVELKPLLHTWSLAVEEQFYLLFPLTLLAIRRFERRIWIGLVAAVIGASLLTAVLLPRSYPAANFYLIPSRAWELGVGALLALTGELEWLRGKVAGATSVALGLVLIAIAVVAFDANTVYPSGWTLFPVLGTALIIAVPGGDSPGLRVLRLRGLVGIGLISYSLYLWHQPILAFLRLRSLYDPTSLQIAAGVALAFVLAWLSWKFAEMPLRRRDVLTRRQVLTAAAITSLGVGGIGLAGHLTDGFRNASRDRARFEVYEDQLGVNHGLDEACEDEFTLDPTCRTSDAPEIVVWGDSYAMHIVDAIRASRPDVRLIQFTKSFCGPTLGIAPMTSGFPIRWAKGCLDFNHRVVDWIESSESVRYVVLSSLVSQYTSDDCTLLTTHGATHLDPERSLQAFLDTMERLRRDGKGVVFVSPTASFGGDIGRCLLRAHLRGRESDCDFPESAYLEHRAKENAFVRRLGSRYPVIWLSEATCHAGTCATVLDSVPLYRDARHFTHVGSSFIGKRLDLYSRIVALGDAEWAR